VTKVILMNGAASTGKSDAVAHLKLTLPLVSRQAKDRLHELTATLFGVSQERYWEIYNNRELKEEPLEEFRISFMEYEWERLEGFLGYDIVDYETPKAQLRGQNLCELNLSIREAMIYVSEIICKPRLGKAYFGKARADSIQEGELVIDDSCGFAHELPPLIERVGQENILLLRIHREGYTFDGDSRGLIPDGVIDNTIDIYNANTLNDFLDKVEAEVKVFLGLWGK